MPLDLYPPVSFLGLPRRVTLSPCFVECFWSNISTVGPRDGWTIDKKCLEVTFVLQRSENRSCEPRFKVDNFFRPVVELYLDKIAADYFAFVTEGRILPVFRLIRD